MGDSELFDYFQDVYLTAETLIGNTPAIPSPSNYSSSGALAAIAALSGPAPGYPTSLNATGVTFKNVIENLTGGPRPTFDDLLVSRAIRDVFHCGFTLLEQTQAFDDLVNWVENGVKPEGDDILDRATVAADDFGCTFTTFAAYRTVIPGLPC